MKFGLLGEHLSHSYSPLIHSKLFKVKDIDATYELIEISRDNLENYVNKIRTNEYSGFNVTIPYKKEIMQYLDVIDDTAKEIGAVNTVYLKDGLVHGTNTDYFGFIEELKYYRISPKNKDCYILGTGGASMALRKAIKDMKGNPIRVSRNPIESDTISYKELKSKKDIDIIINSTPVGMYPNIISSPLDEITVGKASLVVDIIFNPKKTLFMQYAKKSYNGLMMLLMQAAKSEDVWLGKEYNINYTDIYKWLKKVI